MIEPKRVLRALAEHWALLEPLCEHFDQGTLSLSELRAQLAAQQLDSTPQDITSLLDVWFNQDKQAETNLQPAGGVLWRGVPLFGSPLGAPFAVAQGALV
ncbi:hypothetical protein ACI2KL_08760, partial [Pseudomonas yamanorum]